MSRSLKIVLAYDGTGLVGWQRQSVGVSVQALVEDALAAIEGRPVVVSGAGRTDAGVHALGQVASVRIDHPIPTDELARALNARLPDEIRVLSAEEAPDDFHARYNARLKTYRYLVLNGRLVSPFERRYVWPVPRPLDISAMSEAAGHLEGRHDFAALQGSGSAAKTTVRTIAQARVLVLPAMEVAGGLVLTARSDRGRLVAFDMSGDGFLRHMVRNAVGTLVEIGLGRRVPSSMADLLASGDRTLAGPTAPPTGLFLVGVDYAPGPTSPPSRSLAPLEGTL
jgi:tRNA pseudouridine38-40 synthase